MSPPGRHRATVGDRLRRASRRAAAAAARLPHRVAAAAGAAATALTPRQPARVWQFAERLARALVPPVAAMVGVSALIVLLLAVNGRAPHPLAAAPAATHRHAPAAAPARPRAAVAPRRRPTHRPPPPVVRPAVTVFNDSRILGLGQRAAAAFEAAGWPVASVTGLPGRISQTTVYYPPGLLAAAGQLAARFPRITRILPRPGWLPGVGLTVVVTRYWVE